jgi:Holliday junction resolvase RusA-like endonuclease
MTFNFSEPPSANRWWRNVDGRMVTSREARVYKAGVALAVLASRTVRIDTAPIRVTIDWYRGRKSGDLDKRIGVLLDAMQGTVYATDAQIVEIVARRFDDKRNPRVIVSVSEVPS